ncbi:unnamed protein product [Linum trigynum]|uniref:F-box domain-containing protein n=1 Tax=Linum trigynum TaxID=586398 RepID=A0AAV2C8G8_9ROSI
MENLPSEIELEILSRLPISSIIRLKCVSKSLRSVAENPRLHALYLAHARRRDPSLLLHYSDAGSQQIRLLAAGFGNKTVRSDDDLDFTKLVPTGSCNGFLCISDAENSSLTPVCLWNPLTGHRIHLPRPINTSFPEPQHVALGFGPDPVTSGPKIVRVVYCNRPTLFGWAWHSQVQVLTVGATWREIGRTSWNLKPVPSEGILVNSALHWLTLPMQGKVRIVSFDLRAEEFGEIGFPAEELDPERCRLTQLVSLSGHLSAVVCCGGGGFELWVMKEYGVKESWCREFAIDGDQLPGALNPNGRGDGGGAATTVRVLCKLESSGAILLQIGGCKLVTYCPETLESKEVEVSGLPGSFSVTLHMESL